MKRLLIVGSEVPNFPNIRWDEWGTANPLDYQGLLLDCRDPRLIPNHASVAGSLLTFVNNGHTAYVLLPEAKNLSAGALTFLPHYYLYVEQATGQTLNVKAADPLFGNYRGVLTGHEICFRLQQLNNTPSWQIVSGIVDNVSRPVCGKLQSIYLLHPPTTKLEQKAFKIIIEHFQPDPMPISSVPKPSWVDQAASAIPGVTEIQAARASVEAEIQQKREQLSREEEKLRHLSSWSDLLWVEGLQLQIRVGEALSLFGVAATSSDPSGHTGDLVADEAGVRFVFEVTGSSGTIGIEKGRQLMQWVSDSPDPANTKGVLVANAFRNDPPDKRPPADRRIFVQELERLAERYHLALLDVRELYRIVCMKLAGQTVDKAIVIDTLSSDGVVRFPV
jgi:hypothetical protein